jgi:tRNA(Ile)-lysidine synthase TilS/MesJ
MTATKQCGLCLRTLPLEAFAVRRRSRAGRQTRCRDCYAEWYRANWAKANANLARRKAEHRRRVRAALLDYLVQHPCVDCGEADPRCLDFDHRDPKRKKASISRMVGYTDWSKLLLEIAECDVRCANCHRKRTAQQFSWWNAVRDEPVASTGRAVSSVGRAADF